MEEMYAAKRVVNVSRELAKPTDASKTREGVSLYDAVKKEKKPSFALEGCVQRDSCDFKLQNICNFFFTTL